MSIVKKIGIVFAVIIATLFLFIDIWYLYIKYEGAERFVSNTAYLNKITEADGTSEDILTVDYDKNTNGNGYEKLDIKFKYFTDENQTDIYWQGIQYIANSPTSKIDWKTYEDVKTDNDYYEAEQQGAYTTHQVYTKTNVMKKHYYFAGYLSPYVNPKTTSKYNYQSLDGFDTLKSTNPLSDNSYLTVQTGTQLVYLKFKNDGYAHDSKEKKYLSDYEPIQKHEYDYVFNAGHEKVYHDYGIDYLAHEIYEAIQVLPAGTKGSYTLEFSDIFTYYKADAENKVGDEIQTEDKELVVKEMKTYFTFYVDISADGAKSSEDSMFKVLHGSPNFKIAGSEDTSGGYFTGRQLINVDYRHFDKVLVKGNGYVLKLRQDFVKTYKSFTDSISLSITIDLNELSNQGIEYLGFAEDSGLDLFNIKSINILSEVET